MEENSLFDDNDIENLIEDLPMIEEYYNTSNSYEWGLFYTSVYEFSSDCEQKGVS